MADDLYERDFVLWTEQQAEHLRAAAREGSNLPLDWENLAEEIESLGQRDRREAESFVRQILVHLAKLEFSPAKDPRSGWTSEVARYRYRLEQVLKDSPSLNRRLDDEIESIAASAIRDARRSLSEYGEDIDQANLTRFLKSLSLDDVLNDEFYPAPSTSSVGS